MITVERVRELFSYDAETGAFVWRVQRGRRGKPGNPFGCKDHKGYIRGIVDWQPYFVHRLIWLYVHGSWPKQQIDHINGQKSDNRLINLREATPSENKRNQKARKDSTTGIKGISPDNRTGRWRAWLTVEGQRIELGFYSTKEEAAEARRVGGERYHGDFAREG